MTMSSPIPAPLDYEAAGPSLAEDVRLLAEEGKTLAQAEFAFQKSRAAYAGAATRAIAILVLGAGVLLFFALMALVTGTVVALGPILGPWGAMAAVTVLLLILAAISVLSAKSRFKRMMAIVSDEQTS